MARKPKALVPLVSPSIPKRLRTQPGCAALAVGPVPAVRRASSRVNRTLASLARQ